MFDFFKTKVPKHGDTTTSAPPSSGAANSTQQRGNIRRELVRVVLKDTLRLHGVPLDWLACEVSSVTRSGGDADLRVELVIMKWQEKLLRYIPALSQQLLLGLDRFDPTVDHSRYLVSWRFSPDCGCPFMQMPEPVYWLKNRPTPSPTPGPASILDRRQFPRGPKKEPVLDAWPRGQDAPVSNFAPTDVSPLR